MGPGSRGYPSRGERRRRRRVVCVRLAGRIEGIKHEMPLLRRHMIASGVRTSNAGSIPRR